MMNDDIDGTLSAIEALQAPIPSDKIKQRKGGFGKDLDYIEWPTVVRRLDEALGQNNWDFVITDTQVVVGCVICTGRLTVRYPDGTTSTKGQMGGNSFEQGMKPDDAAKGAASDALKKCAALFGIALELAEKDGPSNGGGFTNSNGGGQGYGNGGGYAQGNGAARPGGGYGQAPQQVNNGYGASSGGGSDDGSISCEDCGEALTETNFKDGSVWSVQQLANFGRRKHGRVLDMRCYREENAKKRRAEESLQQVPF